MRCVALLEQHLAVHRGPHVHQPDSAVDRSVQQRPRLARLRAVLHEHVVRLRVCRLFGFVQCCLSIFFVRQNTWCAARTRGAFVREGRVLPEHVVCCTLRKKHMMSTEEKKTLKGRLQKKPSKFLTTKSTNNKLRTSLGCRSTRNDMKLSGIDMESP